MIYPFISALAIHFQIKTVVIILDDLTDVYQQEIEFVSKVHGLQTVFDHARNYSTHICSDQVRHNLIFNPQGHGRHWWLISIGENVRPYAPKI